MFLVHQLYLQGPQQDLDSTVLYISSDSPDTNIVPPKTQYPFDLKAYLNCHILLSCFWHLIQAAFLGLILSFIVILLSIILIDYYSFAIVPSFPTYIFRGIDSPLLSVNFPWLDVLFERDHWFFS